MERGEKKIKTFHAQGLVGLQILFDSTLQAKVLADINLLII